VPSVTYVDVRLSYDVSIGGGTGQIYANANNVFDRAAPVVASYSGFTAAPGQTNSTLYDLLGRRFTVGFKLDF
jgi:outer membrane receptor protein involved in Fe transport